MRTLRVSSWCLVLGSGLAPLRAQEEASPKDEAATPTVVQLFDGHSLEGWTKFGGQASYRVEDGCIVGESGPGRNTFLCTDREFGDFELELELRLDVPGNSGVQLRSHRNENGVVFGYQCEVDPSERAWSGGIYDESRRGWLAPLTGREEAQRAFDVDAWNRYSIQAFGPHLRTWVNGVPCADLFDPEDLCGFLALQVHQGGTSRFRWRNLRLVDHGTSRWQPLFDGHDLAQFVAEGGGSWTVEDGLLHGSSGAAETRHGHLFSTQSFGDFAVRLEFRAVKGNSGLYFHVDRGGPIGILGFQAEIDAAQDVGGLYETSGRAWVVKPTPEEVGTWFRPGDWNQMCVVTRGGRIAVFVNGKRTAELFDDPGRRQGPIALQLHGGMDMDVWFRNVEVLEWQEPTTKALDPLRPTQSPDREPDRSSSSSSDSDSAIPPIDLETLAREGLDIDRAWYAVDRLLGTVEDRYPGLLALLDSAGVVTHYGHRERFARVVRRSFWNAGADETTDALRIFATWNEQGRLPFEELVDWLHRAESGHPAWPLSEELLATIVPPARNSRTASAPRESIDPTDRPSDRPAPEAPRFEPRSLLTADSIALLLTHAEDFLIHYSTLAPGERPTALPAAEAFELWKRSRSRSAPDASPVAVDPRVALGLSRLFEDFSSWLFGLDRARVRAQVNALPLDASRVIAIGGYGAREIAGAPFHQVLADHLALTEGVRRRVVWLDRAGDLEVLLLDPAVRELHLLGHASFGSFLFDGLTGAPEDTFARLLGLLRDHADELSDRLGAVVRGDDRAAALAELETWFWKLGGAHRVRLGYDDFARIAARTDFVKKDRLVLWACGTGEYTWEVPGPWWSRVQTWLQQATTEGILEGSASGHTLRFSTSTPRHRAEFERSFAALWEECERSQPLDGATSRPRRNPDFTQLLAEHSSRFPGVAWIHDYVLHPGGTEWPQIPLESAGR